MADVNAGSALSPTDFGDDPKDQCRRWRSEIAFARKQRDKFYRASDKLEKVYLMERPADGSRQGAGSKFAVLWSNVEILKPAIYSKSPKLDVSRRFDDEDQIGRVAARIMERAGNFDIEQHSDFHDSLEPAALDYLIVGQGTVWARFEAVTGEESVQISANQPPSMTEVLQIARAPIDYVSWEHFLTSPSRTWDETRWVARAVQYTQDEGAKRFDSILEQFGKTFKDVPKMKFGGDAKKRGRAEDEDEEFYQRAMVWEIWDKPSGLVWWIVEGFDYPLDMRADPLKLYKFFPCPKPLLATLASRSMIPKADYTFYQDQATELNSVTSRLEVLHDALQVIGVYDDSQPELADLLKPNMRNRMVPVKSWAAFADKGGLKGVVDFWPLDRVVETIQALDARRSVLLELIYEITGISDIIRGASNPNETLGAQEIKSKFAGLRLESRKHKMAMFAASTAALKLEIMAKHCPLETIMRTANVEQMGEDMQVVQQALQLIKSEPDFLFRVEVATDTMVQIDMDDEKKQKTEFLGMVSNFIREAATATQQQPLLAPLFMEFLKFGVRGFRVGRPLEGKIDQTTRALLAKLQEPKEPPPITAPEATVEKAKMDVGTRLIEKAIDANLADAQTQTMLNSAGQGLLQDGATPGQPQAPQAGMMQ